MNGNPEPVVGCVLSPGAGGCLGLCDKATTLRWLLQLPWSAGASLPWSPKQLKKDRFPLLNNLRQHASRPSMANLGGDECNLSVWDASSRQGLSLTFSSL